MPDIYVFTIENDCPQVEGSKRSQGTAIVWETYLSKSSLEETKARIKSLNGRYGKCRIAKLQFIDETEA